jgi:hypothetical protein
MDMNAGLAGNTLKLGNPMASKLNRFLGFGIVQFAKIPIPGVGPN